MTNVEKVEEKAKQDVERAIRSSKSREDLQRQLDINDVSYKIKDETSRGKKQPYETNH
jgi:hypothetical protein